MVDPSARPIAANRFGLGARPGDLQQIGADSRDWLRGQIQGAPPVVSGPGLRPSAQILAELDQLRREIHQARKANPTGDAAGQAGVGTLGERLHPIYVAEVSARFSHAIETDRPMLERLTYFWTNHFAVSIDKGVLAGVAGAFEREAIRPNVLGYFADLLLAAESHPAMLLYLDNQASAGPHSPLALASARRHLRRKIGINENLGREIMELHTLGVGAGYTQQDVTAFACVLSGWSIARSGERFGQVPGSFMFRERLHEPGIKTVLGKSYPDTGYEQGVAVLQDLAHHPATAHHIATKLARHFVADDPPASVVGRLARAFNDSGGHLPTLYNALIDAPEAWERALAKLKTPSDYVISSYRGLQWPVHPRALVASVAQLGQRTYAPGSPAGWPDRSADWDGASALLQRLEWADEVGQKIGDLRDAVELAPQMLGSTLSRSTLTAISRASSASQALTLLLVAPELMRR